MYNLKWQIPDQESYTLFVLGIGRNQIQCHGRNPSQDGSLESILSGTNIFGLFVIFNEVGTVAVVVVVVVVVGWEWWWGWIQHLMNAKNRLQHLRGPEQFQQFRWVVLVLGIHGGFDHGRSVQVFLES